MSVPAGLLDTSVVIDLPRISDADSLPAESYISVITLAELSVGPLVAAEEDERVARQALLQQVEAEFDPIPFDAAAARAFGRIAVQLRSSGRKPKARAYDALIAATALAHQLPVFTRNPRDFAEIRGLDIVPVEVPESRSDSV